MAEAVEDKTARRLSGRFAFGAFGISAFALDAKRGSVADHLHTHICRAP
jgi:hypothetical protein